MIYQAHLDGSVVVPYQGIHETYPKNLTADSANASVSGRNTRMITCRGNMQSWSRDKRNRGRRRSNEKGRTNGNKLKRATTRSSNRNKSSKKKRNRNGRDEWMYEEGENI
jgi:hypothetical protein